MQMHKTLVVSGLALSMGLAGCANQQQPAQPIQVQELSSQRVSDVPAQYTVVAGDTLYGIAWRHNMDFHDLAKINNISPPYRINVGQNLVLQPGVQQQVAGSADRDAGQNAAVATPLGDAAATSEASRNLEWVLPDGSTETVAAGGQQAQASAGAANTGANEPGPLLDCTSPGANCTSEEASRQAEAAVIAAAEREAQQQTQQQKPTESSAASGQKTYTPVENIDWQWPTAGKVVEGYGEAESTQSRGIDIEGQKGQPVKAAGPGIVVYAGSGPSGYGNLVMIKHNDEYLSVYAHNDRINVKENEVVDTGQVIATMGATDSGEVRLHFEVRKDDQTEDPMKYLPSR